MALKRTCVHDRNCKHEDHTDSRGPIIMPKRSWCFQCDGDGKNGTWGKARQMSMMELMDLEREFTRLKEAERISRNMFNLFRRQVVNVASRDIELPRGTMECAVLVGSALEDFKKVQKLQEVNASIIRVQKSIDENERKENAHNSEAQKGYEELHRLKAQQRKLAGLPKQR